MFRAVKIRAAALLIAGLSPLVTAATSLGSSIATFGFNLESISIQAIRTDASGDHLGFGGVDHTGRLVLSGTDIFGTTAAVGPGLPGTIDAPDFGLAGNIYLKNGTIDSGSVTLSTLNPATNLLDTYTFDVAQGSGSLYRVGTRNRYVLAGLTLNGFFSDAAFGAQDVTPWFVRQPLTGAFVQFNYKPDTSGFDATADLDVIALADLDVAPSLNLNLDPAAAVPTPSTAFAGAALMGGFFVLTLNRRRPLAAVAR